VTVGSQDEYPVASNRGGGYQYIGVNAYKQPILAYHAYFDASKCLRLWNMRKQSSFEATGPMLGILFVPSP